VGVTKLTARLITDAGRLIADEQPADLWQAIHVFTATPIDE